MFISTRVNEDNIMKVLSKLNKKWKHCDKASEYNPYDDDDEYPDKEIYLNFDDVFVWQGLTWNNIIEEMLKISDSYDRKLLSIEEFINQVNNYKEEQK